MRHSFTMKTLLVLCALCFAGGRSSEILAKRDISELLRKKENLFAKPLFYNNNQGYDYPKPGFTNSQGPIFRDPEPTYIETTPVYGPPQPNWVSSRPTEPTWVQNRPVESSFIVRPVYRPPGGDPINEISQKLFWPLFNKPWLNGGGVGGFYPGGSNTVGFPGNNNGNNNYYPSYPGINPNKFSFLGNLFPGLGGNYPNYNYQRISYPAPRPVITTSSDSGIVHNPVVYPVYPETNVVVQRPAVYPSPSYPDTSNTGVVVQRPAVYPNYPDQGFNSIGDSVIVDAVDTPSQGYSYPKPNEQLPPLNVPSVQFRAEPKTDEDASDNN